MPVASLPEAQALSRRERDTERGVCYARRMFSILAHREAVMAALRDATWIARNGTREEQSGRFIAPPGWKGRAVTATDDGLSTPKRGKAA